MLRPFALAGLLVLVLVLALALAPAGVQARPPAPSPLSSHPARIEYLANDAPFVVFDVSPRSLRHGGAPRAPADVVLSFIATDDLGAVTVHLSAASARAGRHEAARPVSCGAQLAGYYRCAIPTAQALAWLGKDMGSLGLRIEAEGLDGDHSTVRITLPVLQAPAAAPAARAGNGQPQSGGR